MNILNQEESYNSGSDLWFSLQDKIVEKVIYSGGTAQEIQAIRKRPWYNKIKERLIQGEPITNLECQ